MGSRLQHGVHKAEKGFTLVEVMIALAIISIGMLAVTKLEIISINTNARAREVTDSSSMAMDYIETLLLVPYDSPMLEPNSDGSPHGEHFKHFDISWSIQEDKYDRKTVVANTKVVTVSAGYIGKESRQQITFHVARKF